MASEGPTESGFTLVEALVALAILAGVVLHFLGTRTEAMIDAGEARNWRVARELAERYLSELRAGAREVEPQNRIIVDIEDYPGFRYQFVIGEASIGEVEGDLAAAVDENLPPGVAPTGSNVERLDWQRERDMLRRAQASGQSFNDYQDSLLEEQLEDKAPREDEFEDVAIVIYFPRIRPSEEQMSEDETFLLKAKISTMALRGMTPEQAQAYAEAIGESGGDGGDAGAALPGGGDN